jgi:hypothetical protein
MKLSLRGITHIILLTLGILALEPDANAQTLYTPGGLLLHPTAYTVKRGGASLYISAFSQREFTSDMFEESRSSETFPVSLNYAVSDRLNLGIGYVTHRGGSFHEDGMYMFANHSHVGGVVKYQLAPESDRRPALAVAATYNDHDTLQYSATLVASKALKSGDKTAVVLHGGISWGQKYMGPSTADSGSVFAAVEKPLSNGLSLVGEYGTRHSFNRDAIAGAGLLWKRPDGTQINMGLINAGRSRSYGFFFGIGIPLGGAR